MAFDEIEAELNHDVIFISQNLRNTIRNPPEKRVLLEKLSGATRSLELIVWLEDFACVLLDHLDVHFVRVDLLIEFGRELGRLEEPSVDAGGHGRFLFRAAAQILSPTIRARARRARWEHRMAGGVWLGEEIEVGLGIWRPKRRQRTTAGNQWVRRCSRCITSPVFRRGPER